MWNRPGLLIASDFSTFWSQTFSRVEISHAADQAAKETEAHTSEQHARESIRIARVTRELLKKFAAAYRAFQASFMYMHPWSAMLWAILTLKALNHFRMF